MGCEVMVFVWGWEWVPCVGVGGFLSRRGWVVIRVWRRLLHSGRSVGGFWSLSWGCVGWGLKGFLCVFDWGLYVVVGGREAGRSVLRGGDGGGLTACWFCCGRCCKGGFEHRCVIR